MILTAKSYMIIILTVIGAAAMLMQKTFFAQFFLLPAMAALIDVAINYAKMRRFVLPSSAVISGLLLAMVLQPVAIELQFVAALIAILSKHVIVWKKRNVFNPAALSVNALSLLGISTAWWIASPVVLIGFFIPYYQHRLRMVATFLAAYFAATALFAGIAIDYAAVFFTVFMLLEPKTSPYTKKGMLLFGAFAALLAVALNAVHGADKFLLALVVMNLFTVYFNNRKLG